MPYLSPPTLTRSEQQALLEASSCHPRDHLIFSLALGTGLRLSNIIWLDVGDVFFPGGKSRSRVRLRREIAKGGRVGDVFLPDALAPKLATFWGFKLRSGESVAPDAPVLSENPIRLITRPTSRASWHFPRLMDESNSADSPNLPDLQRNPASAKRSDTLTPLD